MTNHAPELQSHVAEQLKRAAVDDYERLASVAMAIAAGCRDTAVALRTTRIEKVQTVNDFGDDVLTADLVADKAITAHLARNAFVAAYASEEHPTLKPNHSSIDNDSSNAETSQRFTVTFDPLDGSSIIDSNFAVGSIFAVWRGATCIGQRVGDIVLSAIAVYGPRATLFVGHKAMGVFEYVLTDDTKNDWRLARRTPFRIAPVAKYFSPGNLRAANNLPAYREFLKRALRNQLTLRYTGGMVPDVTQILIKGSGIFATPTAAKHKVKLRVCFECGPLCHMIVAAGGAAANDCGAPFEELVVTAVDQRSGVILGSAHTVQELAIALRDGRTDSKL